ncbi:putative mannosylphosphorylation protein [Neofusicoccum parvum UCRNP2]|uniref:Putative mannosylphosphorylation protein n=1 Tax=Botryosphaeria parva (strain UCR-NP2) TaxID=1287680 RepID=R1GPY0_BOTPV|nr:putative mannosylphosphorylation protein [Neofusicoccum parvum UCRNP2]
MFARLSLCSLVAALGLLGPAYSAPTRDPAIRRRDADFLSVKTKNKQDHSGKGGDPVEKYFHESTFHPHYDGRFAETTLPYDDRLSNLTALVQTYLSTMHDIGAETWIMHGSLLGWWWNRKIMPWDTDIDVQMSEQSMHYLASYYNMTVHHFNIPGTDLSRDYMIEVNPHYVNGSTDDWLNVIDARWIDTETGLFIDITTVRHDKEKEENGNPGWMYCKDKHHFKYDDIFPLRDSTFENMPVKIPYAYTALLQEEYGARSLTNTRYEGHRFDQQTMEWIPLK